MSTYTFEKLHDAANPYDLADVKFVVHGATTLTELLDEFAMFLRACGFAVPIEGLEVREEGK